MDRFGREAVKSVADPNKDVLWVKDDEETRDRKNPPGEVHRLNRLVLFWVISSSKHTFSAVRSWIFVSVPKLDGWAQWRKADQQHTEYQPQNLLYNEMSTWTRQGREPQSPKPNKHSTEDSLKGTTNGLEVSRLLRSSKTSFIAKDLTIPSKPSRTGYSIIQEVN
ncbi:uncharacterized protein PV07_08760 [Cladophialophora immunda]|uniref:Uncharacterized protein n=1 Tax=Cladophialophora immunda TaxID=569365 RepID=A0A0D2CPU8_9EURO|nr:uncharacterized protein PV07_08760 [Cladophialophora immunda]KIW25594.1 hypothetical protein PV07_08760 [Cladophialophora immunda]